VFLDHFREHGYSPVCVFLVVARGNLPLATLSSTTARATPQPGQNIFLFFAAEETIARRPAQISWRRFWFKTAGMCNRQRGFHNPAKSSWQDH
jgi:hypothetical protein